MGLALRRGGREKLKIYLVFLNQVKISLSLVNFKLKKTKELMSKIKLSKKLDQKNKRKKQ